MGGYPAIWLRGNWLEHFGFSANTLIEVKCENNQLIITPREPDDEPSLDPRVKAISEEISSLSSKQLKQLQKSFLPTNPIKKDR